jgi:hypothetical protein
LLGIFIVSCDDNFIKDFACFEELNFDFHD